MTTNKEETNILDLPQREGKDGYIGTLFGLYLKFGGIMAEPNLKETDIRIYYMTKFILNLIPGPKNRAKIKEKMRAEIEEKTKSLSSNEERLRVRNEVCLEYIGELHDFVDKHLGISSENRVGYAVHHKEKT